MDTPKRMMAWQLFGAGMENFGRNDRPCELDVPQIKPDELLVEIEAIGLCFSDVKLIRAGEEHPRVISKDLKSDPVIPGHEAVMRVVKVGEKLNTQYRPGQRFIIQADIYVKGVGLAYGYAINGGMAQYSVIDQRVLNGDEGCYLLPVSPEMPSAVAALLEPWTCVQASYMIRCRTAPQPGGKALIVAGNDKKYSAGKLLAAAKFSRVDAFGLGDEARAALEAGLGTALNQLSALPEHGDYDDIFICECAPETAERAARLGKRNAVCSFIGDWSGVDRLNFDLGSIHYEGFFYQGDPGSDLSAAYGKNSRTKLKKGGCCWLAGGAGAMGQMHTQLAVENPDGPQRILVTDMDSARIENLKHLLAPAIAARKVEFKAFNPAGLAPEEFDRELREFAPDGFDDIVMLVPVVPVLSQSAGYLGKDAVMNIFAGIPAGKEGGLPLAGIVNANQRYIGSSGSRTEHLRHTLELAESGKLKPVTALAAIGGMNALKTGLQAVIDAKFPGKTVIFPNLPDMPLTPTGNLASLSQEISATLDEGGFYTSATEAWLKKHFQA